MPDNKPKDLTFEERVELFRATADNPAARAEYAHSRAEVILPLINAQSTVRAIFRPTRLAPGASSTFDVPFDDIDCCWMMPQIGGIPVVQVEGSSINVDTFGLDVGVEYQEDVARDGRIDVATLSTALLKNKFIVQEELAGWTLIKPHAAALPSTQIIQALDKVTADRVNMYIRRLEAGNFGAAKPLRDGVFELRLDFGPGYRVYYGSEDRTIIFLLGGGS